MKHDDPREIFEAMRSRLDDLAIAKLEAFTECCVACGVLYIFEEARVTRQGRFLEIMLLCPECGDRQKVLLTNLTPK